MSFSERRRSFLKCISSTLLLPVFSYTEDKKIKKAHIVVIGGGFGGATVAKYLKKYDKKLNVTLIEPNKIYTTMPKGNCYISHIIDMKNLLKNLTKLQTVFGVNIINEKVEKVDISTKTVILGNTEKIKYDKLIVSIGIDFKYEMIDGYSQKDIENIPHAWQTKRQLEILYRQLDSMADGGIFTIVPPTCPYRCPPGPYERASLVAEYFKKFKPKSKIIILDQKNKFCKQPLFEQGWGKLYGDMIEWVSAEKGGEVKSIDTKKKIITTQNGTKIKSDVLNIIPQQKAGTLAFNMDLTDKSGWCPVNQQTFESSIVKDIYIIGDSAIAGDMPKSGHSANSQGKLCAASVILSLKGADPISPKITNTCYSLVGSDYGINVIGIYQFNGKKMASIKDAGGTTPLGKEDYFYTTEAYYAKAWHKSIAQDIWGG